MVSWSPARPATSPAHPEARAGECGFASTESHGSPQYRCRPRWPESSSIASSPPSGWPWPARTVRLGTWSAQFCRTVMKSAIAAELRARHPASPVSARHLVAAASWRIRLALGHSRPRPLDEVGGPQQVVLVQGVRSAAARPGRERPGCPWLSAATTGSDFSVPAGRPHRLAGDLGRPPDPQQVIGELEREPGMGAGTRPGPSRAPPAPADADSAMLQAQAISAAVLSPAICRHSSSVTSSRRSNARSAPWPAISRATAADRQRAAQTPGARDR